MDDTLPASIDILTERLYAAEPGDRLRITLPERPTYVVRVVTNDSTKPRTGTDDGMGYAALTEEVVGFRLRD